MAYTRADLYTSIKLISKRSALADATILEMLRQAEAIMNRDLRPILTVVAFDEDDRDSGAVYNLPSDCSEVRGLSWTDSGEKRDVIMVGLSELASYSSTGDPLRYCQISDTQIEFRGTPDTDAAFTLHYWARLTELAAAGSSNAVLLNYRDLYLSGTLAALFEHLEDIEQASYYDTKFRDGINMLNAHSSKTRKGKTAPSHNLGLYLASSTM